jgi:two-component system, response regulator PdtaR
LIVEDETLVVMGLRAQLERLDHLVVGDASTAPDAKRLFDQEQPDLVLMDIRLDETDGIELALQLYQRRACPIIIVSAFSESELVNRAAEAGVFGYLIKPVSIEALAAQIEVAAHRFREKMQLVAENQALTQSLEARKVIEKAKGIVMRRLNLTEADAHKKLQLESQKRRQSITEVCKRIIESEDMLGGGN